MEDTDREIVRLLAHDGRMSYTDLAKATGLSTSAVHQRVRRLEQRGVITGYAAQVSADAIGLPLTAFISVTPLDPAAPDDAPQRLAGMTEIEACHSVAGEESYILKVRVGSPGRPGGPAGPDPGGRERADAHDRRPVHAVRVPPARRLTLLRRPGFRHSDRFAGQETGPGGGKRLRGASEVRRGRRGWRPLRAAPRPRPGWPRRPRRRPRARSRCRRARATRPGRPRAACRSGRSRRTRG